MSKIHKFRPFPTTVGMVNHMQKNYTIVYEQILGPFVYKSLDILRSLQVLSNISKIHKFRLFPTTVGTVNNMEKPIHKRPVMNCKFLVSHLQKPIKI